MSELGDAARDYGARGWPVLPLHTLDDGVCTCGDTDCPSPGKHPRLAHGLKDASTDTTTITEWWTRWPTANIGLVTGIAFDVLDIDGDEGRASFKGALEQTDDELPAGPRTQTGGGGSHVLFAPTGGRNRAGIFPKVDWRGANGYIVAPPSLHASGRRYEWRTDSTADIPPTPQWLNDIVNPPHVERPAGDYKPLPAESGDGTPYGLQALDRENAELARAPQGTRNHALNACAFNLYQLVAGGELNDRAVEQRIRSTGLAIGLSDREVDVTLKSGRDAGLQRPRSAPPLPARTRPLSNGAAATVAAAEPPDDDLAGMVQPKTDDSNALRFTRTHGNMVRYVPEWSTWLIWDGKRWRRDKRGHIVELGRGVVRSIYHDALRVEDEHRKAELGWSAKSATTAKIRAMIELARSSPDIPVLADELDADPWLFNAHNGTIDLRTGSLKPHNQKHLITKIAGCDYDIHADAPRFEAFLEQVLPDDDVRNFVQAFAGYCLTGLTTEQVLLFAHGTGANGKTTLIQALLGVLGDYAKQAEPDLLLARENAHPTGVADLQGARLVVSSEIEDGRRLAESTVKQLTGSDRIKARYMRQDFFEFEPTHKLLIATNHKPRVGGTDHAIWRRIRLVPFDVTIAKADQDHNLANALRNEASGILTWAVAGCGMWQANGLPTPTVVAAATDAYRAEEDRVGAFLNERCEFGATLSEPAATLYAAYCTWTEAVGERPLSQKRFAGRLIERGGLDRSRSGTGHVLWIGIRVLPGQTLDF